MYCFALSYVRNTVNQCSAFHNIEIKYSNVPYAFSTQ